MYILNNWKTAEQTSKKLISNKYLVPKVYSEPYQRFKMELFAKLVNGFHPLTISNKAQSILGRVLHTSLLSTVQTFNQNQ